MTSGQADALVGIAIFTFFCYLGVRIARFTGHWEIGALVIIVCVALQDIAQSARNLKNNLYNKP